MVIVLATCWWEVALTLGCECLRSEDIHMRVSRQNALLLMPAVLPLAAFARRRLFESFRRDVRESAHRVPATSGATRVSDVS